MYYVCTNQPKLLYTHTKKHVKSVKIMLMNFSKRIIKHVRCKVIHFMGCQSNHVCPNNGGGR